MSAEFGVKREINIDKKWNIDRKPSTKERIAACLGATIIMIVAASFFFFMSVKLLSGNDVLTQFIVALLFLIGTLVLLIRVLSRPAKKPSKLAIRCTGYAVLSGSAFMLVVPFFIAGDSVGSAYSVSVGLTGIGGGSYILHQAAATGNS